MAIIFILFKDSIREEGRRTAAVGSLLLLAVFVGYCLMLFFILSSHLSVNRQRDESVFLAQLLHCRLPSSVVLLSLLFLLLLVFGHCGFSVCLFLFLFY